MDSCTINGSIVPPLTFVTAPLGTPGFAGVPRPGFADTPPHGPIFCGSPWRFWTSDAAGEISTKCASAAVDTETIAAMVHIKQLFIPSAPGSVLRPIVRVDASA